MSNKKIRQQNQANRLIINSNIDRILDLKGKKHALEQMISKNIFERQEEMQYTKNMINDYSKYLVPVIAHLNIFDSNDKSKLQTIMFHLVKSITLSIKQLISAKTREMINTTLVSYGVMELKGSEYIVTEKYEKGMQFNWNKLYDNIIKSSMMLLQEIRQDYKSVGSLSLLNFRNIKFYEDKEKNDELFKDISKLEKLYSITEYEVITNTTKKQKLLSEME